MVTLSFVKKHIFKRILNKIKVKPFLELYLKEYCGHPINLNCYFKR